MSNNLAIISDTIRAPETTGKLMLALGFKDGKDQHGLNEARRYASSVLAEVEKTAGDDKKDLTVCRPQSIVQAMVDAAQFRLMIDGRQLAHLIKFGKDAKFMPGYRGYLFKIKEAYPDADFIVEPVFLGDELKIWEEDGVQHYELKKGSVFNDGPDKFQGVLFAVTYTDGGRLIRKVQGVSKTRVERARKAAKQDFVWSSDYIEKAKAAAIKSACKIMFASIQGIQEMLAFDNQNHSVIERPIEDVKPGSIFENLKQVVAEAQKPAYVDAEIVEPDIESVPEEPEQPPVSNLKTMADQIRVFIRDAKDPGDLECLWAVEFKDQLEEIKAGSETAYNFLKGEREKKMQQFSAMA